MENSIARPKITKELIFDAAVEICQQIVDADPQCIVNHYSYPMDGFELSKQLDRYEGWDVTREEMEILDEMDGIVRDKYTEIEKKWFEENKILPPHPIGSIIKLNQRRYGVDGEITGISKYNVACYEVKPIGQDDFTSGNRRVIIKFEDAVLA